MALRDRTRTLAQFVIRRDQDKALDRLSRERGRSHVVREALDRYLNIVPDAENSPPVHEPTD